MADPDYVKQERHKLHLASDNIKNMLEILKNRDKDKFIWAWKQLRNNVSAIKSCFLGKHDDYCKKIDKLSHKYAFLHTLWDELDERLMNNNENMSVITDDELDKIIQGYKEYLSDLFKEFKLDEFEEESA